MRTFLTAILLTFYCGFSHAIFVPPDQVKGKSIPEHGNWGQLVAWTGVSSSYGASQTDFSAALSKVSNFYAPIVASKGARLNIIANWNDGTINAYADRNGSTWNIHAFGGLARASGMTLLGYTMVTCHELGHHMGGAPRYGNNTDWAANEGEADYWATHCMRSIGYSDADIQAAAQSTAAVLASLGGERQPNAQTPSTVVVSRTNDAHPPAQCRLDTYVSSISCQLSDSMNQTDPSKSGCSFYPNDRSWLAGSRPLCWYKPAVTGQQPPKPPPTPTPVPVPVPTPIPVPPNPGPSKCPVPANASCVKIKTLYFCME